MTLHRARIVKGAFPASEPASTRADGRLAPGVDAHAPMARGRRVAAAVLAAEAEAAAIVAAARAEAERVAAEAARIAGAEARAEAEARLAAGYLALRAAEERRRETDLDRSVELAVLLAERLVGESLALEPARIASLAAAALAETRGARTVRISTSPLDRPALESLLREAAGSVAAVTTVEEDASLARGSLLVHTDLGRVDARLDVQLGRLAVALRQALGSPAA